MKLGTKNLLFGDHQFLLHPLFVAWGWYKLFGWPGDLRIWICFFIHDWGYWGKDDMDGEIGSTHPEYGADLAHWLFDGLHSSKDKVWEYYPIPKWHDFCLYHSRTYAKKHDHPVSRLALADKMAFLLTPRWLLLFLAKISGSLKEYHTRWLAKGEGRSGTPADWHKRASRVSKEWIDSTLENPNWRPGYYNL